MLIDADRSQLLLLDLQAKLMPAIHGAQAVLINAGRLAQAAGPMGVPAWGVEQNPERLGENDPRLRAACQQTLAKLRFSACSDRMIEWLRPTGSPTDQATRCLFSEAPSPVPRESVGDRNTLVVAGCEAHVCVLQTALELRAKAFDVWIVTDACGSRTERNRDGAFDRMSGAGCHLVTTEMVIFEWLRTAEHPAFRQLQALIK